MTGSGLCLYQLSLQHKEMWENKGALQIISHIPHWHCLYLISIGCKKYSNAKQCTAISEETRLQMHEKPQINIENIHNTEYKKHSVLLE